MSDKAGFDEDIFGAPYAPPKSSPLDGITGLVPHLPTRHQPGILGCLVTSDAEGNVHAEALSRAGAFATHRIEIANMSREELESWLVTDILVGRKSMMLSSEPISASVFHRSEEGRPLQIDLLCLGMKFVIELKPIYRSGARFQGVIQLRGATVL